MSGWTDVWDLISDVVNPLQLTENIGDSSTSDQLLGASASAAQGTGVFGAIVAFLTALADWHMWASLGWVLLGVVLILAGVRLWTGKLGPSVVPVPV
jgi:hypothetical protein